MSVVNVRHTDPKLLDLQHHVITQRWVLIRVHRLVAMLELELRHDILLGWEARLWVHNRVVLLVPVLQQELVVGIGPIVAGFLCQSGFVTHLLTLMQLFMRVYGGLVLLLALLGAMLVLQFTHHNAFMWVAVVLLVSMFPRELPHRLVLARVAVLRAMSVLRCQLFHGVLLNVVILILAMRVLCLNLRHQDVCERGSGYNQGV